MPSPSVKKYLLDDKPVDMRELIHAARDIDNEFARMEVLQTSVAANILRKAGHTVGENKEAQNP